MSNIPRHNPTNLTSHPHPTQPNQQIIHDTTPALPFLPLHPTHIHIFLHPNHPAPIAPLRDTPSDLHRILTAPEYAYTPPGTRLEYLNSIGAAINRQEPWIRDTTLHFMRTAQLNTAASEPQGRYVLERQRALLEAAVEHGVERLQQAVMAEMRREFGNEALGESEDESDRDDQSGGDEGDDDGDGVAVMEEQEPVEEPEVGGGQRGQVEEQDGEETWHSGDDVPGDDRRSEGESDGAAVAPAVTPARSDRVLRSATNASRTARRVSEPPQVGSQAESGDDDGTAEEAQEGGKHGDNKRTRRLRTRRGDDKVDETTTKRKQPDDDNGDDDERWMFAPGRHVHPVPRWRFSRDGTMNI